LRRDTAVVRRVVDKAREQGRGFSLDLEHVDKTDFDAALEASWKALGAHDEFRAWENMPSPKRTSSTADSKNRIADKAEFENGPLAFVESGEEDVEIIGPDGILLATGYGGCLYGDHGPYLELSRENVHWPSFVHATIKGPGRHYHSHYTADRKVSIYNQFTGVRDEPNPPEGKRAVHNNRADGYADYRSGRVYLSMDLVEAKRVARRVRQRLE